LVLGCTRSALGLGCLLVLGSCAGSATVESPPARPRAPGGPPGLV